MRALDLFCGLGGWSDGLFMEGFDVLGVELVPEIADLYKHQVIVADVRGLNPSDFTGYDLIVGSPPCRDFTKIPDFRYKEGKGYKITPWKDPKNPKRGLTMVNAFLKIVDEAEPRYWLMENVSGLAKHIDLKPRCKARLSKGMYRLFWGNFPAFPIPRDYRKGLIWHTQGKLRKWERARIPLPVARALGNAVMSQITNIEDTK